MEQIQNEMRENQGKLNRMGKRRAMEKQMQRPQLMESTELEPTEPQPRGGGDAGLARVIGRGKRKAPRMVVREEGGSDGVMAGGARHMAQTLMQQMAAIHGPGFVKEFMEGLHAHAGKAKGGAAPRTAMTPGGNEVVHASMTPALQGLAGQALGGQDVPPGGLAPQAYGNVPQAPASFKRNTVGMGVGGRVRPAGAGAAGAGAVSGGARAARGAAIKRIMQEKGLSLGQASKYLKEHGEK